MKPLHFALSLILIFVIISCSNDEDHQAANFQMEFADLLTDASGAASTLLTDKGEKLQVVNPIRNLSPDTTFRYVVIFVRQTNGIRISSSAPVLCGQPSSFYYTPIFTDSVQLQSIWRSSHYINLTLLVWGKNKRHTFGFVNRGVTTASDGHHILHLQLYHNSDSDMLAFPHTSYLSCSLKPFQTTFSTARDSIYFVINEIGKGPVQHRLAY
ncbi:MAG: NigD-like C-terminal domain-containing protein [Bacteroidaceae bacterium]|jgi:hypothetical protein|nr:NigD-like C-terminal domain-containing protein [Bacteroidaceae bacterium]